MNRIAIRTAAGFVGVAMATGVVSLQKDFTPHARADSVLVENELNGKFIVRENVYFDIFDERGRKVATICVPRGFETDFGSIPRACRGVVQAIGTPRDLIYLLHDWLYATEYFAWVGVTFEYLPGASENRAKCDELLLLGCKQIGDAWLTRNTIWSQVRIWGYWFAWSHHTPETIVAARALLTQTFS